MEKKETKQKWVKRTHTTETKESIVMYNQRIECIGWERSREMNRETER